MKNLIFYFSILVLTLSCTGKKDYKNSNLSVDERVKLLLKQMTLEEKIAQLHNSVNGPFTLRSTDKLDMDNVRKYFINGTGFLFMGDHTSDAKLFSERVNRIQEFFVKETRLGIPALIGSEGLHGFLAHGATSFPQNIALGGTFDPELIEKIYTVAAREMRAWGVTQVLSPNVDLGRDPRFGRVEETYSEDPYLTSQIGLAAVRGFQGRDVNDMKNNRVVATLKHFAGHGEPQGGRNTAPVENINSIDFHENHLLPFETCVKEGNALCVMASYNDADGVPNHANKPLLTGILVGQFGFKGYVISDLGGIRRLINSQHVAADAKEATLMSFDAGVDMELANDNPAFLKMEELVKENKVSEKQVDQAVSKILRLKFLLGLFANPYVDPENAAKRTNTPSDKALALEAAEKAAVLLKNENLLPLDSLKIKSLAVIGPMAATIHLGGYSYEPFEGISVLEGLQKFGEGKFKVTYAEGCKISTTPATFAGDGNPVPNKYEDDMRLITEAVKTASKSDVVVLVIGENESFCREAWSESHLGDRDNLDLPGRQNELVEALLKTGRPIIAIMIGGRPLSFNFVAEKVPAIFQAWYLGQETGIAIANLLFGKTNPSGKLSITIPRSVGQLPCYYNHMPTRNRSYLWANSSPLFPFGFGLSYSTFEYSDLKLSKTEIKKDEKTLLTVSVKNTGRKEGSEVVQLYVRDEVSSVVRPVIQLKDFKRIYLKPGEVKTVDFIIDNSKLSFFNQNLKRIIEPGIFDLKVGGNSRDLQSIKLTVI